MSKTKQKEKMVNFVDYPTAWDLMKKVKKSYHHPQCSYTKTNGGLLCDCGVIEGAVQMRKIDHKALTQAHQQGCEEAVGRIEDFVDKNTVIDDKLHWKTINTDLLKSYLNNKNNHEK